MSIKLCISSVKCEVDIDPKGSINKINKILFACITKTMISRLNENDRIIEIAKMLEGNNASKSAYTHAKQLLN